MRDGSYEIFGRNCMNLPKIVLIRFCAENLSEVSLAMRKALDVVRQFLVAVIGVEPSEAPRGGWTVSVDH